MNELLHDVSWVIPYRTELLTSVFEAFTWLGYPTFMMLFLPLGYWLWNQSTFTRLTVVVILSTLLNSYMKDYWQNPRPDALYRLDPEVGKSFGMPSGHAQISAVLWFGLALQINKRWLWFLAGFLVTAIAMSRIYLGIHDLEDILAGWALAALSLVIFVYALKPQFERIRFLPVWMHIVAILILQFVLYKYWPGFRHSISGLTLAGFLCGWLLGAELDRRLIHFEIKSGAIFNILVAVLGIAGLLALNSILQPLSEILSPYISGTLQTILIAFYMTAVAPYLFKLIGLSKTPSAE